MLTGKVQPELLIYDRSELVGGRRKECRLGLGDGGGRSFFLERGEGFESISLYGRDGETLGVCVTDREVSLCADDVVAATYDRISGALKSASLSLPRALIEAQERGLAVDEELSSRAWRILADGGDLTVVVRFDGVDERIALIRTNGVVNCPEGLAFPADMAEGYEEDGEGDPVDLVYEEEDGVLPMGELLTAWRRTFMDWRGEFAVGIRTLLLDFILFGEDRDEFMIFHVNQMVDFLILEDNHLSGELAASLIEEAFPLMDWG
jgi:hypothetical protein